MMLVYHDLLYVVHCVIHSFNWAPFFDRILCLKECLEYVMLDCSDWTFGIFSLYACLDINITVFENHSISLILSHWQNTVEEVAWLRPISFRCLYVSLDQFSTKIIFERFALENVSVLWDIFGDFQTECQLSIRSSSFPFLVSVLGIILHLTGKE